MDYNVYPAPSPKETLLDDRAYTFQGPTILNRDTQDRSMNSEQTCPCCSNILLRHISNSRIYWRCGYCYQEMPVMEDSITPLL